MIYRYLAVSAVALGICFGFGVDVGAADKKESPTATIPFDLELEIVPKAEAAQIETIIRLTTELMKKRYPGEKPIARGVHPKDHGCVTAKFQVLDCIPEELRKGVFAKPGREYQAFIRYSNADVLMRADSFEGKHGSRGMAIKLLKVDGDRLIPKDEPLTQDFLMVNQPVFAFANVEDYEVLSQVLLDDKDVPTAFFSKRIKIVDGKPDVRDPATLRALKTGGIVRRIQSLKVDGDKGAFQEPPGSPEENVYHSGAPYLFGTGHAMKYSVHPVVAPTAKAPDVSDADYLRKAFAKRLTDLQAKDIVLEFRVQVRSKADLKGKLETEIEDACTEWKDPFVTVARITIPPQDFDTEAAKTRCENLFFTPWHSVKDHRPLGGINRLKLGVYEASSALRHFPKEPSGY